MDNYLEGGKWESGKQCDKLFIIELLEKCKVCTLRELKKGRKRAVSSWALKTFAHLNGQHGGNCEKREQTRKKKQAAD